MRKKKITGVWVRLVMLNDVPTIEISWNASKEEIQFVTNFINKIGCLAKVDNNVQEPNS